MRWPAMA